MVLLLERGSAIWLHIQHSDMGSVVPPSLNHDGGYDADDLDTYVLRFSESSV